MEMSLADKYLQGYNHQQRVDELTVNTIHRTEAFDHWLAGLMDLRARAKITLRIRHAELGHFGNVKALENGVCEMRVDWGPGYRVYFARKERVVYLLLCGGDKSTQQADIRQAKTMWAAIKEERT